MIMFPLDIVIRVVLKLISYGISSWYYIMKKKTTFVIYAAIEFGFFRFDVGTLVFLDVNIFLRLKMENTYSDSDGTKSHEND